MIQELLETSLPGFERDLRELQKELQGAGGAQLAGRVSAPVPPVNQAIASGMQKFTNIPVPILAIFALPHDYGAATATDPAARASQARDEEIAEVQAKAFESGLPSAKVVRIPHADHYVFRSNEVDVLREMSVFLNGLP